MKKIALSGIQTSGTLHIGNYLGSINNWLKMQNDYDCYFFLADLHSITVNRSPDDLRTSILHAAAIYLAAGIDADKSVIFAQSSVPQHSELAWLLNCATPIGWLKRMTQFKDKAGKKQDHANTGLFTYPVLMAADILLYDADVVPVGEDQKQHLELARDIAGAINRKFDTQVLNIPEPMILNQSARIMSLRDGTKKMSKSDPSDASRINLTDTPDQIIDKLKRAKTDSHNEVTYDKDKRPEISNMLDIFSAATGSSIEDLAKKYHSAGFANFKKDLADAIINKLTPIKLEYDKLMSSRDHLISVLNKGSEQAKERAEKTLHRVKNEFGFIIDN